MKKSHIIDVQPKNNIGYNVIPQIMTNDKDDFIFLANYLTDLGHKEMNWNLGCPYPMVAKKGMQEMSGVLMDRLDIEIDPSLSADPGLLEVNESFGPIEQCLVSHLLKSNCPVTGQPDWASVQIRYQGRPILEEGLLRYLIGFRQKGEFHEHCVETIFCDIKRQCKPEKLSVYARYTRRGGLDINPFRTDHNAPWPDNTRHARQ